MFPRLRRCWEVWAASERIPAPWDLWVSDPLLQSKLASGEAAMPRPDESSAAPTAGSSQQTAECEPAKHERQLLLMLLWTIWLTERVRSRFWSDMRMILWSVIIVGLSLGLSEQNVLWGEAWWGSPHLLSPHQVTRIQVKNIEWCSFRRQNREIKYQCHQRDSWHLTINRFLSN